MPTAGAEQAGGRLGEECPGSPAAEGGWGAGPLSGLPFRAVATSIASGCWTLTAAL